MLNNGYQAVFHKEHAQLPDCKQTKDIKDSDLHRFRQVPGMHVAFLSLWTVLPSDDSI